MDPNFSRRNVFVYHNNPNEGPLIMKVAKYIEKNSGISMNLVKAREVGYAHTLLVVICPVVNKTDADVNALLDSSRDGQDILLVIVKRAAENSHISLAHLSDPLSATTRNRVGSACTLYFSGSQKFKGLKHENALAMNEIKRVVNLALDRKAWSTSLPVAKNAAPQSDERQFQFIPGHAVQPDDQPQSLPVAQVAPVNQQQNQFIQPGAQPNQQTVPDQNQNVQPSLFQQGQPFQQQTQLPQQNQQAVQFPAQTVPAINLIPPGPATDPFMPVPVQQPAAQPARAPSAQPSSTADPFASLTSAQPSSTADPFASLTSAQPSSTADPFALPSATADPTVKTASPQQQSTAADPFAPRGAASANSPDPFGDPFSATNTTETSKPSSSDPFEDAFGPAKNLTSSDPFGDAFGDAFAPQKEKEKEAQLNFQRPSKEVRSPVYYFFEDKSPLEEDTVKFLESHGKFQLKRCRQQTVAMVTPLVVFSPCYTIPDADAKSVLNRCRDGEDVYLIIIEPVHSHAKKPATLSASLEKKIGAYGVLSYSLKTKTFDVTDQNTSVAAKVREFVAERQALVSEEEEEEEEEEEVDGVRKAREESSSSNRVIIEGLPESGFDESDA